MADPTDPTEQPVITTPTDDQIAKWSTFEKVTAATGETLEGVGGISSTVSKIFVTLTDKLKSAGVGFGDLNSMTDITSRKFGILTTTLLGAREAFKDIAGVDASRLVTYGDQFKELFDIIEAAPGAQAAKEGMEKLKKTAMEAAAAMGKTPAEIAKIGAEMAGDLTKGLTASARAFFTSADNAKRLENSMIQMTLAGSGMQDLLKAVGSDFQDLDATTKKYSASLDRATAALGGSKKAQEQAASYMAIINKMPGGLGLLTQKTEIAGQANFLLEESLKIAAISGRKEEEVLEDINKTLQGYKMAQDDANVAGGAAATLQARMATIAGTLHANIQDVRGALMESTDAFKMFVMDGANVADMTKGMADAMENYTSSLEAVGVPAANAIEMFRNYTGVMKNMNLGQQAFLSTMSGGPGGLRGAFKIQDQISKGDFEGLRKQVEGTVRKIGGGTIATKEQALSSEAGAAQYARQIQILQQGPLGSLAKSIPEAEALLKAMASGKKLDPGMAAKSPENKMQDAMKAGQKIQQDSYTELTKINSSLNSLVLQAGFANKKTAKNVLGTGNTGSLGGGVGGTGRGITPGQSGIGVPANDALEAVGKAAESLPKTVKNAWDSFTEAIGTGNKESIQKANDKMVASIKDQRAVWDSLDDKQKEALTVAQQAFSAVKSSASSTGTVDTKTTGKTVTPTVAPTKTPGKTGTQTAATTLAPVVPKAIFTGRGDRAAQKMPSPLPPSSATATGGATGTGTKQPGGGTQGLPGQTVPVAVTVNITGACPHCGNAINHSPTDSTVSQGTNQPK